MKRQLAFQERLPQQVQNFSSKNMAQHPDGQEEPPSLTTHPAGAVQSDATARDDAVQVRVMPECLPPSVQHGEKTEAGCEPALSNFEQRLGHGAKQDAVDNARVLKRQGTELMRQREHDMKVDHGQRVAQPLVEPLGSCRGLALRAMPVAAGVVGHLAVAALVALKHVAGQSLGAAGCDVGENPALLGRGRRLAAETRLVGSHDSGQCGPLRAHGVGVVSRSKGLRVELAAVGDRCR